MCRRGKKPSFLLPENTDLRKRWIYFVNPKDWIPTKNSVICINHFEDKFIKQGKQRSKLIWELHPVHIIHVQNDMEASPQISTLRTPIIPRRSPRKRPLGTDVLQAFRIKDKVTGFDSFTHVHAPVNQSFKRHENTVII